MSANNNKNGNKNDERPAESSPPNNDPTASESSVADAFAKFWKNQELHDVQLKTTDGRLVGANRFSLATRSKVFEKMFLGGFREGSTDTGSVEIPFDGDTVGYIVEYLCTDTVGILNENKVESARASQDEEVVAKVKQFKSLASLTVAADYFDLPTLCMKITDGLAGALDKNPQLSFLALDSSCLPQEITELAWVHTRSGKINASDSANKALIQGMSVSLLEKIISDETTQLSEFQLFEILHEWSMAETENSSDNRKQVASDMIKHLKLEQIHPSHLMETVTPSGLASKDVILKAFHWQALVAVKMGEKFEKPRHPSIRWKSSGSVDLELTIPVDWERFDILDCPPITTGKWEVKFKVVEGLNLGFGVALQGSDALLDTGSTFLGNHRHTWGFFSNGEVYHDKRSFHTWEARFGVGNKITLTIDLTDSENNGSIWGSVDSGKKFLIFKDMCDEIKNGRGLVPGGSVAVGVNHIRVISLLKC